MKIALLLSVIAASLLGMMSRVAVDSPPNCSTQTQDTSMSHIKSLWGGGDNGPK